MTKWTVKSVSPDQLAVIADGLRELDEVLWAAVHAARTQQDPLTWAEIGEALGMTKQAAWEKHTLYRRRNGTTTPAGLQEETLPLGPVERSQGKPGNSAGGRRPRKSART